MSSVDYTERYRQIWMPNGIEIRAYILGEVSDKEIIVITDSGEFLEMRIEAAARSVRCSLDKMKDVKLKEFGLKYSEWEKSWVNNNDKMAWIENDWANVMLEDEYVNVKEAIELINNIIRDMHGYTVLVSNFGTQNYGISMECRVPMAKELCVYVSKCELTGMKQNDIQKSERFKDTAKKLFMARGMLWGSEDNSYKSGFSYELKDDCVVHLLYKLQGVFRSKRSIEEVAKEILNELKWRGIKSEGF